MKEAETNHGIVSIPIKQELVKSEIVRVVKEGGGESINYMDIIKMTLRIVNLDDTSEYIDVESFGRGLDPGDKGFGKASTYARKYALLNAYKIATGEDPDEIKSKAQAPATVDEVKNTVISYMMTDNQFTQNILSYFNVGSADDMTNEQFKMAYNNLKKKGKI